MITIRSRKSILILQVLTLFIAGSFIKCPVYPAIPTGITSTNILITQENQIPSWKQLLKYQLKQFNFDQTTESNFLKLYPEIAQKSTVTIKGSMKIYSYSNNPGYRNIDFGFNLGKLKWIDCIPTDKITIQDLLKSYGNPNAINKNLSPFLLYYDYDHLTVTLSKKTSLVHSITILDNYTPNAEKLPPAVKLPNWSLLNKAGIPQIIIGKTTEKEFLKVFPNTKNNLSKGLKKLDLPSDSMTHNIIGNTTNSSYELTNGVQQYGYKKVEFFFENGILIGIEYLPLNLQAQNILKAFGANYIQDTFDNEVTLYNYNNVVVSVFNDTEKVLGIIQALSDNFLFAKDLPPINELIHHPSVGKLQINKTTEDQFLKQYPDLIYNKKNMPDGTIFYAITQGLVGNNLSSVILTFKDNVLNAIEFRLNKKTSGNYLIKMYGKPLAQDSESDPHYEYLDYSSFIVTIDKATDTVSSITLL